MVGIGIAIVAIFTSIGAAVAAVAVAVAAAVSAALAAIGAALVYVGSVVVGAIAGVLTGVGLISAYTAGSIMSTLGVLNVTAFSAFVSVGTFVSSVAVAFSAFTTAIHLDALLKIHKIAYILSAEYRSMMNNVYNHISKLSEELGMGPYLMAVIIENTRSVVASASAIMGRNFDLFEVTWLKQFHGAMEKMNVKINSYKNNPSALIHDLDDWITKPTLDNASTVQLIIFQTMEKVTQGLEEIVDRTMKVRDDLEQFVHDLPKEIRDEIEPKFKAVTKYMDDFITERYDPGINLLNESLSVIKIRQKTAKENISGIVNRLLKPADYLHEIDDMTEDERLDQERKIGEISTRQSRRDGAKITAQSDTGWQMLLKIREALGLPVEKVAWHIPEIVSPGRPAMAFVKAGKTWFVGDY